MTDPYDYIGPALPAGPEIPVVEGTEEDEWFESATLDELWEWLTGDDTPDSEES